MAPTVLSEGRMMLEYSGRRCEAQAFWLLYVSFEAPWTRVDEKEDDDLEGQHTVACRTVLVRTSPRGVVTVIQPSWSLSDTIKAGVFACKLTLPVDNNILNIACTNLYGHLCFWVNN